MAQCTNQPLVLSLQTVPLAPSLERPNLIPIRPRGVSDICSFVRMFVRCYMRRCATNSTLCSTVSLNKHSTVNPQYDNASIFPHSSPQISLSLSLSIFYIHFVSTNKRRKTRSRSLECSGIASNKLVCGLPAGSLLVTALPILGSAFRTTDVVIRSSTADCAQKFQFSVRSGKRVVSFL